MNYNKLVCLDLEMTCWDDGREPRTGEIIEVGLAKVDLAKAEIEKSSSYIVKPDNDEVSEFCTELTGHTQSSVNKQGRPLADVLETVVKNYGGRNVIYGSWGRDDEVLRKECSAKGIEYPFKEYINLATVFRMQHRVKNKRFGHRRAMKIAGLDWEGRQHSGVVDAQNLARLALTML